MSLTELVARDLGGKIVLNWPKTWGRAVTPAVSSYANGEYRMKRSKQFVFGAIVTLPMFYFGGCGNAARVPARFELGAGLGSFVVTAGETTQNGGTGNLGDSNPNIGSGAIRLDADDIAFIPADTGGGKGLTTSQTSGSFTVTAGIAAVEDVETVCDTPVDEYGPFTVTLDADSNVTSITPSSIELVQTTIDLINGGAFSICLTVESTVDGTVTIDALSFLLGL